jgi:hypothetical protein
MPAWIMSTVESSRRIFLPLRRHRRTKNQQHSPPQQLRVPPPYQTSQRPILRLAQPQSRNRRIVNWTRRLPRHRRPTRPLKAWLKVGSQELSQEPWLVGWLSHLWLFGFYKGGREQTTKLLCSRQATSITTLRIGRRNRFTYRRKWTPRTDNGRCYRGHVRSLKLS